MPVFWRPPVPHLARRHRRRPPLPDPADQQVELVLLPDDPHQCRVGADELRRYLKDHFEREERIRSPRLPPPRPAQKLETPRLLAEIDVPRAAHPCHTRGPGRGGRGVKAQTVGSPPSCKWLVDPVMKAGHALVPLFRKPVVRWSSAGGRQVVDEWRGIRQVLVWGLGPAVGGTGDAWARGANLGAAAAVMAAARRVPNAAMRLDAKARSRAACSRIPSMDCPSENR